MRTKYTRKSPRKETEFDREFTKVIKRTFISIFWFALGQYSKVTTASEAGKILNKRRRCSIK